MSQQLTDHHDKSQRLFKTGQFLTDLGRALLNRPFGETSVSVSVDGTLTVSFKAPDETAAVANALTAFAEDDLDDLMARLMSRGPGLADEPADEPADVEMSHAEPEPTSGA